MRRIPFFALALLVAVFFSSFAWAQLPTATLTGNVTDPQGASVAGAKIEVTNKATGEKRNATTTTDGRYVVSNLAPGVYDAAVDAAGFSKREFKDVQLEVGRSVTLDVPLSVAKVGEVVTVTGGEAQVQLTQSEVAGQINSQTVESIPLNGRNFLELAFLLPGNRPGTNYDPTKTNTLEVSSAGNFGRGGNITVDGGDNNDEVVGGTLTNFPQDGIREFQIATNKYTAEVGRSGSSIINIITKSGTNNLHGGLFFYMRHNVLQGLPGGLGVRGGPTPDFDREQYGGSVGGPLKKDRAWWFVAVEDRTQRNAVQTATRDFASDNIVSSFAPGNLQDFLFTSRADFKVTDRDSLAVRYSFKRDTQLDAASLRRPIGTLAQRQDSLNRYNSILADWTRVFSSTMVNQFIGHIDYFINEIPAFGGNGETFCVGVTGNCDLAHGNELRFPDLQDGESFRIPQRTRLDRYQAKDNVSWNLGKHQVKFGAEWQNFGSDILFDLFGSGRIDLTEDFATQDRNGDGVIDDRDIPIAFTIQSAAPSKLQTPPKPPSAPYYRNNYFGFYVQDDWRVHPRLTLNLGLRWELDTQVLGDGPQSTPCADPTVLTTTGGCVWIRSALGTHDSPGFKNFGPRLGFAWDPFGQGKTVVRGGYGIYYDRVVLEVPLLETLLDGRILRLDVRNGSSTNGAGMFVPDSVTGQIVSLENPSGLFGGPFAGQHFAAGIGINVIDDHARTPLYQQFTFGIQQQLGNNWVLSADGLHNYGYNLLIGRFLRSGVSHNPAVTLVCPDGITPCTITDPATGISDNVTNIESSAKFWYDGLLTSVQKRMSGAGPVKWGFTGSYTLSKTFNYSNDDQIPFNGAEDQQNLVEGINNIRTEKGFAPTDERHRFVFHGVFDVPWGISFSPIWTWSSSVPMDIFVPSLNSRLPIIRRNAGGRDIQNGTELNAAITEWNNLPLCTTPGTSPYPCHVGGALPLLANPGSVHFGDDFNSFDLRVTKTFSFTERQKLDFITEVFNLFNVTNIRGVNNNNFSGFNNALGGKDFNKPIRTAGGFFGSGGPRAFQFALKYRF